MTPIKHVYLDSLTPKEFEELIGEILQRLFPRARVYVTQYSRDYGVDVKVIGSRVIYVQCKYYKPSGSVGRPIVQKLHSIMVSDDIKEGMVITTGKISKEAVEYARRLKREFGISIHLIDRQELKRLAKQVGILLLEAGDVVIYSFKPKGQSEMMSFLKSRIKSYPISFEFLVKPRRYHVEFIPTYFIVASINKQFTTTTGRVIYRVHDIVSLLLPASAEKYGEYLYQRMSQVTKYISSVQLQQISVLFPQNIISDIISKYFDTNVKEIIQSVRESLSKKYTRVITYYGNNNVRYTKLCEVKPKDIKINETRKIAVPIFDLSLATQKHEYFIRGLSEDRSVPLILSHNLPSENLDKIRLCNACGDFVTLENSITCFGCGAIVCKHDSMEVSGRHYCDVCYEQFGFADKDVELVNRYGNSTKRATLAVVLSLIPGIGLVFLKTRFKQLIGVLLWVLLLLSTLLFSQYLVYMWVLLSSISLLLAMLERRSIVRALQNLKNFSRLKHASLLRKAPQVVLDKKWRWYQLRR